MFKMKNISIWMVLLPLAFMGGCISDSGTYIPPGYTGRAVQGRLLDANNQPVSGAVVTMVPVDYVPSLTSAKSASIAVDTSDANGNYRIPARDSGVFNIDCRKDTLGSFIDSVKVPHDSNDVQVPDHRMKKLGVIKGVSSMPGENDTNQIRVTLYIPGTSRITKPVIGGAFSFQDVPEGRYQILIDPTLNSYHVRVIDTMLSAGETLDLGKIELSINQSDTVDITVNSVSGTWGPGRTYRVYNDITIPAGAVLTVLPGAKVIFMGNYNLGVIGTLISNGKPDSLILYGCAFSGWGGISVDTLGTANSVSYSIFEKADPGLYARYVAYVSHCVFRYCKLGIMSYAASFPLNNIFTNNVFHDNAKSIRLFTSHRENTNSTYYLANNIMIKSGIGVSREYTNTPEYIPYCDISLDFGTNIFGVDTQFVFGMNGINDTTIHIYPSSLDPGFVSLSRGHEDYHLKPTSPCKGTGMNGTDMGIYSTYVP